MKLRFLGAAGEVTGSGFLVDTGELRVGGLSAHADRAALLAWVGHFRKAPRQTWVVHGEPLSAHALRDAIQANLGWTAEVPSVGQQVDV